MSRLNPTRMTHPCPSCDNKTLPPTPGNPRGLCGNCLRGFRKLAAYRGYPGVQVHPSPAPPAGTERIAGSLSRSDTPAVRAGDVGVGAGDPTPTTPAEQDSIDRALWCAIHRQPELCPRCLSEGDRAWKDRPLYGGAA